MPYESLFMPSHRPTSGPAPLAPFGPFGVGAAKWATIAQQAPGIAAAHQIRPEDPYTQQLDEILRKLMQYASRGQGRRADYGKYGYGPVVDLSDDQKQALQLATQLKSLMEQRAEKKRYQNVLERNPQAQQWVAQVTESGGKVPRESHSAGPGERQYTRQIAFFDGIINTTQKELANMVQPGAVMAYGDSKALARKFTETKDKQGLAITIKLLLSAVPPRVDEANAKIQEFYQKYGNEPTPTPTPNPTPPPTGDAGTAWSKSMTEDWLARSGY